MVFAFQTKTAGRAPPQYETAMIPQIRPADLKRILDAGDPVYLVDVRGPDEYAYYCYQMGYVDKADHDDPANYAALDGLIGQMEADLLAHEALLC